MRSYHLTLVLMLIAPGLAQTAKPSCSVEDSKRAFDAVDRLDTWEALRGFYRIYLPCDDGGIAEGVSDAITKLLADKWADFWRLRLTSRLTGDFKTLW